MQADANIARYSVGHWCWSNCGRLRPSPDWAAVPANSQAFCPRLLPSKRAPRCTQTGRLLVVRIAAADGQLSDELLVDPHVLTCPPGPDRGLQKPHQGKELLPGLRPSPARHCERNSVQGGSSRHGAAVFHARRHAPCATPARTSHARQSHSLAALHSTLSGRIPVRAQTETASRMQAGIKLRPAQLDVLADIYKESDGRVNYRRA